MAFNFGSQPASAQSSGFEGFGSFGARSAAASAPLFGASSGGFGFGASSSPGMFGASSASAFGATSSPAFGFGQQQSQPSMFGATQQQQPQQNNQLTLFGATQQQQPQQQNQFSFAPLQQQQQQHQQQQQQQQGPLTAYAAAQMAPASQEVIAIAQAFSKNSDQYPFRHLFLNVVDDPRRYGRPKGVTDLEWREAVQRAGGVNNADNLWPVLLRGFDELLARKNAQDTILKEHKQRLESAVEMAARLQRNEETLLRGKMDAVKRRHAELSGQLLRVVRAVDGLEGRFAEASHHHNSKARQAHAALAQDLSQVEAALAPNSAVGLISRAEALAAAAATLSEGSLGPQAQPLSQHDLDSIQSLLIQNQKVLTKLQEVLRKDDRDVAIMSQPSSDLVMMTA